MVFLYYVNVAALPSSSALGDIVATSGHSGLGLPTLAIGNWAALGAIASVIDFMRKRHSH